jgi:hypothetical protein
VTRLVKEGVAAELLVCEGLTEAVTVRDPVDVNDAVPVIDEVIV